MVYLSNNAVYSSERDEEAAATRRSNHHEDNRKLGPVPVNMLQQRPKRAKGRVNQAAALSQGGPAQRSV